MAAALTITGNTNDALAAIAKLERQYDSLENKIKRIKTVSQEGDGGFGKMSQGATQFAQQVIGITTGIDLMFKGIQLANKEWQDFAERQGKALSSNQTYARTLETLAFNTAGDAKFDTLSKVESLVNKLSKDTGVGVNDVARALSNAASAKGQLPLEDAAAAVKAVLKFMPNSTGTQDVLAGSVLDIRKHVGGATPEDAIGFTAMLGQQARITDPTKVAENAVPAAILMSKIDKGNLSENAAIYAAITQATGDVQGRTSRTGGIALAMQLEQALPDMKDTLTRTRFMQDNPDAAKAFLYGGEHNGKSFKGLDMQLTGPNGEDITFGTDKASFEKKVIPAIRELFQKDSATARNLDSALQAIPSVEGAGSVYSKQLSDLNSSPTMRVAARDRALQATAERTRIADAEGASGAAVRAGFEENMSAQGIGAFYRQEAGWAKWFRERLGQSPEEAAINTARAYAIEFRQRSGGPITPGQFGAGANAFANVEQALTGDGGGDAGEIHDKARGIVRRLNEARQRPVADQDPKQIQILEKMLEELESARVAKEKRPIAPNGNREPQ